MKKFILILFFIPLLFAAKNLENVNSDIGNSSNTAQFKLMETSYLWGLLHEAAEPTSYNANTTLEVGFRYKYSIARKYASLKLIEEAFGMPVFNRGPHGEDMNFDSKVSFGYYNPEFLTKLKSTVQSALANPVYKMLLKQIYKEYFQSMAHTYLDAHDYLNDSPEQLDELTNEYLYRLADPKGISIGSFQEKFRDYADKRSAGTFSEEITQKGDWYEEVTAPAFWLRRSIDGTSFQMHELLSLLIKEMEK